MFAVDLRGRGETYVGTMQRLAERQRAAVLSLSSAVPEEETDAVAVASLALA
jgi:hypothetical protein